MSAGPMFHVEWKPERDAPVQQSPVVHVFEDGEHLLLLYKKEFHKVKLNETRWARWD